MKKEMTLKARFILTSYCSVVISIMLIGIASYCLLGSMSKKFMLQTSEEAVRQKNEDIQTSWMGLSDTPGHHLQLRIAADPDRLSGCRSVFEENGGQ